MKSIRYNKSAIPYAHVNSWYYANYSLSNYCHATR